MASLAAPLLIAVVLVPVVSVSCLWFASRRRRQVPIWVPFAGAVPLLYVVVVPRLVHLGGRVMLHPVVWVAAAATCLVWAIVSPARMERSRFAATLPGRVLPLPPVLTLSWLLLNLLG